MLLNCHSVAHRDEHFGQCCHTRPEGMNQPFILALSRSLGFSKKRGLIAASAGAMLASPHRSPPRGWSSPPTSILAGTDPLFLILKPPRPKGAGVLVSRPTLRIFLSDTGEGRKIALVGDRQDFSTDVLQLRLCQSFGAIPGPHSHVVLNTLPQSKGAAPHLPSLAGR